MLLQIWHLQEGAPFVRVLGKWFNSQNVTWVPSRSGPLSLSNRTGISALDLKGRFKHLRRRVGTARVEGGVRARAEDRMKTTKDNGRKWMWRFLGVLVAVQLYFVRELLAAFALFAAAFAALAIVVIGLYMLQKTWEVAVGRVAASQHPAVNLARRSVAAVENMALRPLRRPGSATAR